jgi:prepilin-type N-terminal cleavage/methylation domain-containing protein
MRTATPHLETSCRTASRSARSSRDAFTITELLVVIGIIALLAGLLFVALSAATKTSEMADSMNRMRQISTYMVSYSTDNRETVLPSRFDYSGANYGGKVRSVQPITGEIGQGSWADILWTQHDDLRPAIVTKEDSTLRPYRTDSPDAFFSEGDMVPTPHGDGAREIGEPGYFAANDFFDATQAWWSTGQVKAPERSMYLVDSFYGETIAPTPEAFFVSPALDSTQQVDFRYTGLCLMLFLDGHVSPEADWLDIDDLEENRGIKVRALDQR